MDVFENVHFVSDLGGNVSKSEIKGVVKANSNLSGMPIVEMGLNDKVSMESSGLAGTLAVEFNHVQFHKCVDLGEYENN